MGETRENLVCAVPTWQEESAAVGDTVEVALPLGTTSCLSSVSQKLQGKGECAVAQD